MTTSRTYSLIGYAHGAGAVTPGCAEAPRVLRSLHLTERLEALGLTIHDLGDCAPEKDEKELASLVTTGSESEQTANQLGVTFEACQKLAEKTSQGLNSGSIPLIIGGDHSLSIGSVAAVSNFYSAQGRDIGLIWVDTHTDINTPETSHSHRIFGMSVACLLGQFPGLLSSLQLTPPAIKAEHLVYIGVRDLDHAEKLFVKQLGITAYTIKDIDILGMAEVTRRAINQASKGTAGYVVSFDLDVCDPQLVPGTGTPVRGGLSFREAHLLLELIAEDARLLSFEMVELNPKLDKDFATAQLAISLIESALGKSIL